MIGSNGDCEELLPVLCRAAEAPKCTGEKKRRKREEEEEEENKGSKKNIDRNMIHI